MIPVSQAFIPMGVCLFLLTIFIIYRICVLKNGKPFFPIIAVLLLLMCVPYSYEIESKPIDLGNRYIGDYHISVSSNGYYNIFERKDSGFIETHKIPCDRAALIIDDSQPSYIYHSYLENRIDYKSLVFRYMGIVNPANLNNDSYTISIHSNQLPAGFVVPNQPVNPGPVQNTAPASETIVSEP